jgi:flagellar basal body rod protein FlgG
VLGPDGRPTILSVNATPLMANGLPLVDKNGKPCRVNPNGQVTDSSGRVILGVDGKAMALGKWETFEPVKVGGAKVTVKDPTGKTAVLGLNAQLFDSKGNPIVTAAGAPVYFDGRTKSLIDNKGKVIKLASNGRVPGKIATLAFQTVTFAA